MNRPSELLTGAKVRRWRREGCQTCHDDHVRATRSILFVLANGGRGGMQSQVLTIARALSERGHRVTVAVGGGDLAAPDGVDVVSLPKFSPVTFFSFVRALRHLRREVRADVVHGHGLRLAPALRVVGSAQRFVTCHGLDPEIARRAARLARWSAVPVISCGRGPFELLQSLGVTSHILNNAFSPSATSHSAQQ